MPRMSGRRKSFVTALQARGGTEMVPPMKAALTDPRASDTNTVRQVVFLTDGEIGNEQQLFDTIGAMRGRSRVFMVGIGSAPNTFLMTRAAELGRGTFTHIGAVEQVEERMRALFGKIESPAVTNLTATFSSARGDATPAVIPDLYRGEPVALAVKVSALSGTLQIKGTIGDQPWSRDAAARPGCGRQGPLEALGAPQDHRCRYRAHAAHDHAGRSRQPRARARARASSGDPADQPRRRGADARAVPMASRSAVPTFRSTCRLAGTSTRYSAANARSRRCFLTPGARITARCGWRRATMRR